MKNDVFRLHFRSDSECLLGIGLSFTMYVGNLDSISNEKSFYNHSKDYIHSMWQMTRYGIRGHELVAYDGFGKYMIRIIEKEFNDIGICLMKYEVELCIRIDEDSLHKDDVEEMFLRQEWFKDAMCQVCEECKKVTGV